MTLLHASKLHLLVLLFSIIDIHFPRNYYCSACSHTTLRLSPRQKLNAGQFDDNKTKTAITHFDFKRKQQELVPFPKY